MPKGEEIPKTSPAEIEHLIEQVQQTNLDPSAKEKIARLLRTVIFLINLLQRKNLSIRKLREMVFGPRTEKRKGQGTDSKEKPEAKEEEVPGAAQSDGPKAPERDSSQGAGQALKRGHGRRAAAAYPGARRVQCRSAQYRVGDRCPGRLCEGRLYDLEEPKVLLQFTGQPLIAATQFEREVLRCWSCQERYTAPLPEGVKEERYDATADATIALMKYGAGLPFYRQSGVQAMCGVPLGEATMWERCESVADAGLGVFLLLRQMAAGGEVIHTDDTRVRILSCLKEDEGKKKEERLTDQHQRGDGEGRGPEDRLVCERAAPRGGESGRTVKTTRRRTAQADPDERRAGGQLGRQGRSDRGEVSGARPKKGV
jgi:hypothetical protein